jgi:hypothetical protein
MAAVSAEQLEASETEEEEEEEEEDFDSGEDSDAEMDEIANLELEFPLEDARKAGKQEYLAKCAELKIVPIALFIAKMEADHVNLNHHGMGVKGALAVAECLKVNDKILSINLGDNWLGDQGSAALADVLAVNRSLTSLALTSNRIGLPGARALAAKLRGNTSLAELNLRGNQLDDRSAVQLAASVSTSTSLTRLDVSYNHFGEEAGRAFGEMLAANSSLFELNIAWNGLGRKGGARLADGLRRNYLLNRLNISYNGLGDEGSKAVSEVLSENTSLTHLDVSHNRINSEGALALASGIEGNKSLLELELGFNPMGMSAKRAEQRDLAGVEALVKAIRLKPIISSVGLTEVEEGASATRGRASRFDPANPAGHYTLDLSRAWDQFIAEKLWARVSEQRGESWANVTLDGARVGLLGEDGRLAWQLPTKGILELDHVDWKAGLEIAFRLDLSRSTDRMLATRLLERAATSEGEAVSSSRLDDAPHAPLAPERLPAAGILKLLYVVTRPVDSLALSFKLELADAAEREIALDLWRRELTTSLELWRAVEFKRGPAPVALAGEESLDGAQDGGGDDAALQAGTAAEQLLPEFVPLDHHKDWIYPLVRAAAERAYLGCDLPRCAVARGKRRRAPSGFVGPRRERREGAGKRRRASSGFVGPRRERREGADRAKGACARWTRIRRRDARRPRACSSSARPVHACRCPSAARSRSSTRRCSRQRGRTAASSSRSRWTSASLGGCARRCTLRRSPTLSGGRSSRWPPPSTTLRASR